MGINIFLSKDKETKEIKDDQCNILFYRGKYYLLSSINKEQIDELVNNIQRKLITIIKRKFSNEILLYFNIKYTKYEKFVKLYNFISEPNIDKLNKENYKEN